MARYDIESYLKDLGTYLKANLNAKIAAIAAEKGDGIILRAVDSNAYYLQTMNNSEVAFDPYLFYGISDIQTQDSSGPATVRTYRIDVMLILGDEGTDSNIVSKILRYHRALEEVIQEKFSSIGQGVTTKMQSLVPIRLQDLNNQHTERVCGVALNVTIG